MSLIGRKIRAVAAGSTVLIALAATLTSPAPAEAASSVTLDGQGYGHGIGMSQYGANGRAVAGHSYAEILAAYYPGTALGESSDSSLIRVLVTGDLDGSTAVRAEDGMTIRTPAGRETLPTVVEDGTPSFWRVRLVSGALTLEALVDSSWRPHGVAAIGALLARASYADFGTPDGSIRLDLGSLHREYAGVIRAVRSNTTVRSVVVSTYASYLPSVVTSEMPSSWHAEALAAQAVAARTYAKFDGESKPSSAIYDTCDSTQCQVFNGIADYTPSGSLIRASTAPSTRLAVARTDGDYVAYGGEPAFTQFSASNGGFSAQGSRPYLQAAHDPYDRLSPWSVRLTSAQLEAAYPTVGRFRALRIERDGLGEFGGRAVAVTVVGSASSLTVSGSSFRSTLGLRSTLFSVTPDSTATMPRDFSGDSTADLLATHTGGRLYRWNGNDAGGFASAVSVGMGWSAMGASTVTTGFSGSGSTELVAADAAGRLYLYRPTSGRFAAASSIGTAGWQHMDVLIGTTQWAGVGSTGLIARNSDSGELFYYGWGNRRFQPRIQIGVGWHSMRDIVFAGDVDGDGTPDLLAVDLAGTLWLYPGNGSGGFLARDRVGSGWLGMGNLVGGTDWNGDGRPDLVAQNDEGKLMLYPGNGSGGFGRAHQVGTGWTSFQLIS